MGFNVLTFFTSYFNRSIPKPLAKSLIIFNIKGFLLSMILSKYFNIITR